MYAHGELLIGYMYVRPNSTELKENGVQLFYRNMSFFLHFSDPYRLRPLTLKSLDHTTVE